MRILPACLILATLGIPAAAVHAQTPVAAAPTAAAADTPMSSTDTPLGDMIDSPAAKAILTRHLPEILASPNIDQARGMTLRTLQNFASDQITDAKLAAIDAELAKLPAK